MCPEHVENGIESFGNSLEMLFPGGHWSPPYISWK
jgi:hypothetical protein